MAIIRHAPRLADQPNGGHQQEKQKRDRHVILTRGACARKLGSRQNAAPATTAATGPRSRQAHQAMAAPRTTPRASIRTLRGSQKPIRIRAGCLVHRTHAEIHRRRWNFHKHLFPEIRGHI